MLDGIELKAPPLRRRSGRHDRRGSRSRCDVGWLDGQDRRCAPLGRPLGRGLDGEQGVLVVSTAARRRAERPSARCSVRWRCSAASAARSDTCSSTFPNTTSPLLPDQMRVLGLREPLGRGDTSGYADLGRGGENPVVTAFSMRELAFSATVLRPSCSAVLSALVRRSSALARSAGRLRWRSMRA
jgi:hypothetical protein